LGSSQAVRERLLLTLLFLAVVGVHRTWDLRGYTSDGLALLTGRKQAYGYRYTEAFLSQIAYAGGAETFTDALARWTMHLWKNETEDTPEQRGYYIDGHRKPVYSKAFIPRGLVGRLGAILGGRALTNQYRDLTCYPKRMQMYAYILFLHLGRTGGLHDLYAVLIRMQYTALRR
jgi:hypothetical protein